MTTEFSVRGSAWAEEPPERGVVRLSLSFEGPSAPPVYEQLVAALDRVRDSIGPLTGDDGAISEWSTQTVRTWADRPWHERGKRLPLVHHASVSAVVEFRDFGALSRWVGEHVEGTAGFTVSGVSWTLTEERRRAVERDVRARAVREAAGRAQEYADALDLGPVRPVAVADIGMLSDPGPVGAAPMMAAVRDFTESAPELGFEPEDIRVTAAVDARFVAD